MKIILLGCIVFGALYVVSGIVSVTYIALHHRSFVKKFHIRCYVEPFRIKTAVAYALSTLLSIVFWPVALIFYKFIEQEELDRSDGALPELGIRPWR